jgi:sugar phosphate isomerase/epimerase
MKWIPGLVSISFRELSAEALIRHAKETGLQAIEWGGDVHVPAGDTAAAARVAEAMKAAGLTTPEYGSYYVIGKSNPGDIDGVIACAGTLGTDTVRVWAYDKSYSACTAEEYANAVADAKRICDLTPDLQFCLECHNWTLTEDYRDALRYLRDVDRSNFRMFWQPNQFRTHAYNVEACAALLPYIVAVHVFSWEGVNPQTRQTTFFPLDYHTERWREYLTILENASADNMPCMLEFMHDGRIESLPEAARTLLDWL